MSTEKDQANHLISRVYALGSNGCGQLGVGHQEDLNEPQICRFTRNTRDATTKDPSTSLHIPNSDTVKKLVAGGNHTIVLTEQGHVYAAGNNVDGRCGIPEPTDMLLTFHRVSWADGRNITDIAATWEATFFVAEERTVWACGSGHKGELGLGESVTDSATPTIVFEVPGTPSEELEILQIRGSMSHLVVLLSNGNLYGWGSSRKGQLGLTLQSQKITWSPQLIELSISSRILHMATGRDFTFVMNAERRPQILGDFKAAPALTLSEFDDPDTKYESGWSTIYAVSRGAIKSCGQNRRGQIPPNELPPVAALAAGSEHCISLLKDGRIAAWGWGEHGNCGSPLDERASVVERFNTILVPVRADEVVKGVGAGCASSFIWSMEQG